MFFQSWALFYGGWIYVQKILKILFSVGCCSIGACFLLRISVGCCLIVGPALFRMALLKNSLQDLVLYLMFFNRGPLLYCGWLRHLILCWMSFNRELCSTADGCIKNNSLQDLVLCWMMSNRGSCSIADGCFSLYFFVFDVLFHSVSLRKTWC